MSASQILQNLYSLDTSSPDISRLIYGLIRHDEEERYLSSLQGLELARLIDFLDQALDAIGTADDVFRRCLRKLQVICSGSMTLPSSYTISGDLTRIGDEPTAFGGFADVWEGAHCGTKVCIKALRVTSSDGPILTKLFFKEVVIWKRLRHPNIVSLIGVTMKPLQMVSGWMPNGTLIEYVENNPGANRIGLLLDVAEGLNYLHTNHTIHADLKGPNILIDQSGHARLTDFGLASITRGTNSVFVTQPQGYTAGWAAPEILMGADETTREADMFALGTVVIEAFTGGNPFSGFKSSFIILKIINGERPARPQEAQELGLVDSIWDMTLSCWQQDPSHRPTAAGVVEFLRECYTLHTANPPSPILAPWRQAENVDCATNYTPIFPTLSNGKQTPPQPLGISRQSGQPGFQTHETSTEPSSTRALSDSVRADGHSTVPTSYVRLGDSSSEAVQRHTDEVPEELTHGDPRPGQGGPTELLPSRLRRSTVTTSPYELEGVVREGDYSQRISQVIEIWKGRYKDEAVALKVFKVSHHDPQLSAFKKRVDGEIRHDMMMKFEHENLITPYGVSTTVATFCLVYPWYKNGNIMSYLEKKPDVNRFDLLSDAVRGLRYLHERRWGHTSLRPSHVLINDNGVALLDTQSIGDIDNYRYSPPESQFPTGIVDGLPYPSRQGDMYGIGMIIYEVLTGNIPHSGCGDAAALSNIRAGKTPERPSEGIPDPIWQLLEKCWSMDPWKRPSTAQVYNTLSGFRSVPPAIQEVPGKLRLEIRGIKILFTGAKKQQFSVNFLWGNHRITTPHTTRAAAGDEYTWDIRKSMCIGADQWHHGQSISIEVFRPTSTAVFKKKKDKLCATGEFSLLENVNKEIDVKLEAPGSTGVAVLWLYLTEEL